MNQGPICAKVYPEGIQPIKGNNCGLIPFGMFFDVKCKRPESTGKKNLAIFPPKRHMDSVYRLAQFPHQSGKDIKKVLTLIRLLLCDLIRVNTTCEQL